ncbi:hypothetical protein [Paenibacillus sp. NAIST15-1]|uniref:hypothetical protein n=1 Tax=Paenibacillus sp. NAIST15-1 TaxID=1605994 RepID=UPI00086A27ED|nr:hypothetical protein [Paenibacillus sp. NAIST15-1]GAV11441.1 DNA primase [Paenibacillus sp. NAIST15-1]
MGCSNFRKGTSYYTCSNPDGDARAAININIENLSVMNHTRNDFPKERADIITLVEYIKDFYFTKAMNWICEVCGYDYYHGDFEKEKIDDPCLLALDVIESKTLDKEIELRKLDDRILFEYVQYPHILFLQEGISLDVQKLFEVGYSVRDSCITIPIRDELGSLVGVKGRTTLDYEKLKMSKYWFPYATPKSQILYGLDKSYQFIKDSGKVLVYEAEKSVQKSFSYNIKNCVSIGGHILSETQVMKLEKLGVDVILAFDKNVTAEEIKDEARKFIIPEKVYTIFEQKNKLLDEKDAPVDKGRDIFIQLLTTETYRALKQGE